MAHLGVHTAGETTSGVSVCVAVLVVALVGACSPPAVAQERAPRDRVETRLSEFVHGSVRVLSDGDAESALDLAKRFDAAIAGIHQLVTVLGWGELKDDSSPAAHGRAGRLDGSREVFVWALTGDELRGELVPGIDSDSLGVFFESRLGDDVLYDVNADGDPGKRILLHEAFHLVSSRLLPPYPRCLREGLAEVIAVARMRGDGLRLGGRHPAYRGRLSNMRPVSGDAEATLALFEEGEHSHADPAGDRVDAYAHCWELARLLVAYGVGQPSREKGLPRYFDELREGKAERVAWSAAFGGRAGGPRTRPDVGRRDLSFVIDLDAASLKAEAWQRGGAERRAPVGAREGKRLSAAESGAAVAGFHLRRGRHEQAGVLLGEALEREPDLDDALELAGHLELRAGSPGPALDFFSRAGEVGPTSDWVLVDIARAVLEYERQEGREIRDRVLTVSLLRSAVAERPDLAPTWHQLAEIRAASGDREGVVEACREGLRPSPIRDGVTSCWRTRSCVRAPTRVLVERQTRL